MQINCWHEVGRRNPPKETVGIRGLRPKEAKSLREAIRRARAHEGEGVLFALERGYSGRGRMLARTIVGLGVVVVFGAAIIAFVAPSATGPVIGFVLVPAAMAVGITTWVSWFYDTGVQVRADGTLRVEGWGGRRELDLASFTRVTVAKRRTADDASVIGG